MKRVYLKSEAQKKLLSECWGNFIHGSFYKRECPCDEVLLKFTLSGIYSHRTTDKNSERKELIFSAPALFFRQARPSCECRSSHLCPINFAPIISARISQCRCLLGIQPVLSYALRLPFSPLSLTVFVRKQISGRHFIQYRLPAATIQLCIQRFFRLNLKVWDLKIKKHFFSFITKHLIFLLQYL